ncbi:MAG: cytidine deaminase, partial [Oscillospiraceae bacterium]|nr:cytidine deaminase [Oscillospiraceae bacterium]
YLGVNIENASYPAGICAERCAICAAVSAGETEFSAIAIAGGDEAEADAKTPCHPCGICRQVLSEFCPPEFPVVLSDGVYLLGGLLPHSFTL